jgi:HEAT repeat protein
MGKVYIRIILSCIFICLPVALFAGPRELFRAIRDRSLEGVARELQSGTDVNCADEEGNSPLHRAVDAGSLPVVKLLLASGARPNARNIWGTTPLHLACRYAHADIEKTLVTAGAGVNPVDINGSTPLVLAEKATNGVEVAAYLKGKGARGKRISRFDGRPFVKDAVSPGEKLPFKPAGELLGEMNEYLLYHDVGFLSFPVVLYPAELDGDAVSTEGVAFGSRYVGEGHSACGFLAYDGDGVRAVEIKAYPFEDAYMEITDLDDDGVNEIVAVGSTNDMGCSEISVYTVRDGSLHDQVWGRDFGVAYFHYDFEGDGTEEIIGLGGEGTSSGEPVVSVIRKDARGLYRPVDSTEDLGDTLVWLLEKAVMEERIEWFARHGGEDIPLLVGAVHRYGKSPRALKRFQANLERIYAALEPRRRKAALAAMAFTGNTAAVPFLKNVITQIGEEDVKAAAVGVLAVVAGEKAASFFLEQLMWILKQAEVSGSMSFPDGELLMTLAGAPLRWGDRSGVELVERYALAAGTPAAVRGDLAWHVLGHWLPYTADVLRGLARTPWDERTRRGAANALDSQNPEVLRLIETPFWEKMLGDKNTALRAQAAFALGRKKDAALVPALLRGLGTETDPRARWALILALSELIEMFPASFKKAEAEGFFLRQLMAETDTDNKAALLRLCAASLDVAVINKFLRSEKKRVVLDIVLNIVRERRMVGAASEVMGLIGGETADFVPELAVETLGVLDTPAVRARLRELLGSSRHTLRGQAAVSLGMLRDRPSEQRIIDMFLFDDDNFVRGRAARALGLLGTARATSLLLSSLRRGLLEYYDYGEALEPVLSDPRVRDAVAAEMDYQATDGKDHAGSSRLAVKLALTLCKKNDARGRRALQRWAAGANVSLEMQLKALEALCEQGVKINVTLPVLLTEHDNRKVRVRALAIMDAAQPHAP